MNTIKLYLHSMAILIKSQMQYPVSFLLQTIAQLIMEGGEFLAVLLIVDRFDILGRWMPGDLYFFFGMMSVSFYLTECFGNPSAVYATGREARRADRLSAEGQPKREMRREAGNMRIFRAASQGG